MRAGRTGGGMAANRRNSYSVREPSPVRSLIQTLDYLNLALYSVVAVVALWQWRAGRGRAALWAALTFLSLAIVVDVGPLLPEDPETTWEQIATKGLIESDRIRSPGCCRMQSVHRVHWL